MVRLAYNGLDTGVFFRGGEHPALPWGEEPAVVIGVVCALRPDKGLGTLMEAFRKVKAGRRGVKLLIVGSGPMLPELLAGSDADCHPNPDRGTDCLADASPAFLDQSRLVRPARALPLSAAGPCRRAWHDDHDQ